MKPEKVKSRWRRNSEMENTEKSTMSPTLETCDENSCSEKNESVDEETLTAESVSNQPSFPVYESLDENVYLFEIKRTKGKKEVRRLLCDCHLATDDQIPCGDECLNRLLMIECGSRCVNQDSCSNKRFQKRQYAKTEPFKTEKKGWGLKVLENVSKGSFIIEYVGEVIDLREFKLRVKQYARKTTNHFYFMALKSDQYIDATKRANLSRFINHSCEPNIETQKWTVNGLLRVGFFAKRDITAGEELTFDYKFERYGREPQVCFCESKKCNGFIGGSSDITVDIHNNDSKCNNKRKRDERKKEVVTEDLMLEGEIEKLSIKGIRNKEETLMLARLMVRAEDAHSKEKLLDIILNTSETACLRLFLDYHGLSLIWSWMVYLKNSNLKTKILKALSLLPVPNRTILFDSKVLNVVENWSIAETSFCSPPENCEKGSTSEESESLNKKGESKLSTNSLELSDESTDMRFVDEGESKPNVEIAGLAKSLIEKWKFLKDDFRIPRRGDKNESDSLSVPCNLSKHSDERSLCVCVAKNAEDNSNNSLESKDCKDSLYLNEETQKIKVVCNIEEKFCSYRKWGEYPHQSKLSNEDKRYSDFNGDYHRSRWGKKKSKERRESKNSYHNPSHFNGFSDYYSSPSNHLQAYDPYNFSNNLNNDNIDYPLSGVGNIQFNSMFSLLNSNNPRPPLLPTPGTQSNIIINPASFDGGKEDALAPNVFVPHVVQMPFLPITPSVQSPIQNFSSGLPLPPPPLQQHVINVPDSVCVQPINSSPLIAGATPCMSDALIPPASFLSVSNEKHLPIEGVSLVESCYEVGAREETPVKVLPAELPPNWRAATDAEGNTYFYHTINRVSQWTFPTAEEPVSADLDNGTPTYDEPDLKHATKSRKSQKKHSKRKSLTTAPADTSSQTNNEIAKKIKELFRTKMSSFVVQCLNPYRKEGCRVGKITSNEDFKHLARKLTHFVMAKELKHCKNVQDLECNDSVKQKARVYIHKMMARYGPLYKKEKSLSPPLS